MIRQEKTYNCSNHTGLDPARPLIEQLANSGYRLTRDDADVVQIIHTNAGTLGQKSFSGSLDLCINGGSLQPFCRRGLRLSKSTFIFSAKKYYCIETTLKDYQRSLIRSKSQPKLFSNQQKFKL